MKNNLVFFVPFGMNVSGGVQRVIVTIANCLIKKNYDITILTYNSRKSFYSLNEEIKIINLGLEKSENYFMRKIQPLFYINKFRKEIKKLDADTIISIGIDAVIVKIMSLLFIRKKINKIAWEHNSYFQPTYTILKFLRLIFYRYLDKIFVLNSKDAEVYKEKFGEENVCVIPNPLPWKSKEVSDLNNKVIISVGRLDKVKGFDLLIKAFEKINNKFPEWELKIFGKDEGEKIKLTKLIKKLNLDNVIELNEPVRDIKKEYLNASIYAMSSRFECFPMVLLEAKECGLPIVSFNCPSGPRDLVTNGIDGFLVDCKDYNELSNKIIKLIDNKNLRKRFGYEAKSNIQKYSLSRILDLFEEGIK